MNNEKKESDTSSNSIRPKNQKSPKDLGLYILSHILTYKKNITFYRVQYDANNSRFNT